MIKRLVAVEGDVVENPKSPTRETVIPKGYCWVEGDNRKNSLDSRVYGPINIGKNQDINNIGKM